MEARSLPPQRASEGSPLRSEPSAAPPRRATWRRAATFVALITAPWVVIGGLVAAVLVLV